MHIACFSFGLGALLVNIAVKKALPDEEKFSKTFDINFNENNEVRENKLLNFTDGLSSKIQKSETTRLLDSYSSV